MRFLFTGDSITDGGRRTDSLGLGSGYVDMLAPRIRDEHPDADIVNTGVSGDRVSQVRERLEADVVSRRADVATILIGINDILVAFYQGAVTPDDAFRRDLDAILSAMTGSAPRVLVLEPFFIDSRDPAARWGEAGAFVRGLLDTRREWVADAARAAGAGFVPLQARFDAAAELRGTQTVAYDGVHPSSVGHALIADAWWEEYRSPTA
jgi:lysophospholipase L1-like esterase